MNEREQEREMELKMERWAEGSEWLDAQDRLWSEANEAIEEAIYHSERAERAAKLAMVGISIAFLGYVISFIGIMLSR